MKYFLRFAGLISAALALVAFILMMASNALVYTFGNTSTFVPGSRALFGEATTLYDYKPAAPALIAWILVIVAFLILIANFLLPLLKVKGYDKIGGILGFVAIAALVGAGVLLFFTQAAFSSANNDGFKDYKLTFGYVFAAILLLASGVIAFLPTAFALTSKK